MKDNSELLLGIDLGGTKIKAGLSYSNGSTYGEPISIPTMSAQPAEVIINNIVELARNVMAQADTQSIPGIGIGSTGPLDVDNGVILDCNNLPTMHYYNIKSELQQRLGLPIILENDANAMMLGETYWGAGKQYSSILGITLGTGLGAALITNHKIIRGANDCSGEVWTSPYKDSIIEDYVSGTAISKLYYKATGKKISGKDIAQRARIGEYAASEVWNNFSSDLAYALSWMINITDPEAVILGGSVINSADLFLDKTITKVKNHICSNVAEHIQINIASLGDDAGWKGACALLI